MKTDWSTRSFELFESLASQTKGNELLFYKAYIKSELNVGSFTPANPRPLYEELGQKIFLYPTSLKEKSDRALELFSTNPEERKERYIFRDNLDTNQYFEVIAVIIDENITKDELTLEIKKAVETWGFGVVRDIQVDECKITSLS